MTQNERVLAYIDQFGSITTLEAVRDLGVLRLASRINDITRSGVKIKRETIAVKNRYDEQTYVTRYSREVQQ